MIIFIRITNNLSFLDGVNSLAAALSLAVHPDHLVTLTAVSHLVATRLSQQAIAAPEEHSHQVQKSGCPDRLTGGAPVQALKCDTTFAC